MIAPFLFLLTGAALLPEPQKTMHPEWTAARSALLGLAGYGLLGEFSLITGIGWKTCFCSLFLLTVILAGVRARHCCKITGASRWFFGYYMIGLSATVTVLFPIPGLWDGDWYENIRLGQGALTGVMSSDLIGRTPVFGASSLPPAVFTDALVGIAIASCAAAATAVFLIRGILLALHGDGRIARWTPLLFCLSGMFLQHAAFPWAKFLACACLLAGAGEILWQRNARTAMIFSSFWLAVAVATHQAAVLFVPAVLCVWWLAGRAQTARAWMQRVLVLVVCMGCLVAPYELWTTAKFGWSAKVARNPTVYYRAKEHKQPPGVIEMGETAAHVFYTTFLPDPSAMSGPFTSPAFEPSLHGKVMRGYFFFLTYTTTTAGTLIIAILPLLCFPVVWQRMAACFQSGWGKPGLLFLFCLGLAVVGNAVLNPYSSPVGSLQTGLTPFGALVFCALTACILQRDRNRITLTGAVMFLQTLPWFLLQAGILTICTVEHRHGNDSLWLKFWKEDDFQTAFEQFGASLGYRLFPFQIVFYLATFAVLYWAAKSSTQFETLPPPTATAEAQTWAARLEP